MLTESTLEQAALHWFDELGYTTLPGAAIAPGQPGAERDSFAEVILAERLRTAIVRGNPDVPVAAHEEALRQVLLLDAPSLLGRNRLFHRLLTEGVEVEAVGPEGRPRGELFGEGEI